MNPKSPSRERDDAAVAAPQPQPSGKKTILLVDDHPITRQGLRTLINQQSDLKVCGETGNAPQAVELFQKIHPDLAIVDIGLKTSNGIELTKNLISLAPSFPVLILSMYDEKLYAERAIRAGAKGYMMKQETGEKILIAICRLLQGEIYVSENVKTRMLQRFVTKRAEPPALSIETLSDREMEIFQLIGDGYSTRQIAERLNLGSKTVDSYREQLKMKLNLASGAELVRFAIQWGQRTGQPHPHA